MLNDAPHLEWVREQRRTVPLMASVCTGSLVYAAAGLLAGRPATTHWESLGHLRELEPTADVRDEQRFVDDGDLITSAGVSAGIDMSLHLVARLAGVERAKQVRRGIQYDPAPPVQGAATTSATWSRGITARIQHMTLIRSAAGGDGRFPGLSMSVPSA